VELRELDHLMKVRVLRAFWFDAKVQKPGTVVDLPTVTGREVVYRGSAELAADEPPPAPAPMTTESVSDLIQGKAARKGKKDV
jgi:hypothetical protein